MAEGAAQRCGNCGPFGDLRVLYDSNVTLTHREREIVDLLRLDPLLDAAALAERLGATKASVAVHLSNLTKKGVILGRGYVVRPERRSVVVVGGANMDVKAQSRQQAVLRTSNPGTAVTAPGGVGRNIAENLARLGTPTHLVAPIGRDAFGEELLAQTRAAGVLVDHMIQTDDTTGTYLAMLDADGELLVAVSNMEVTDRLTVRQLAGCRDLIAHCDFLVLDGNLPPAPAVWLLDYAAATEVPVVMDPVSVAKAGYLAESLTPCRPLFALTPNHDELCAIVRPPGAPHHRERGEGGPRDPRPRGAARLGAPGPAGQPAQLPRRRGEGHRGAVRRARASPPSTSPVPATR